MRKEKPALPKEPVVFTVRLSRSAEKFLDRLPDKHFGQLHQGLQRATDNPRDAKTPEQLFDAINSSRETRNS